MMWVLFGIVCVFMLVLVALISVDSHLNGKLENSIPDLRTIEEVIKAYDKLRARHGADLTKFISRALAVQNEIEYERTLKSNKKKRARSK